MNTIKEQKIAVRRDILSKRKTLDESEKNNMDSKICRALLSLATYRYCDTVLFYYPLGGEVDVIPAIQKAWEDKKKVYLPRCSKHDKGVMDFYLVTSFEQLEKGSFGVMEPLGKTEKYNKNIKNSNAICIMPALSYDRKGYRLGYGRGYYDRYLQGFSGMKIGIAYSQFVSKDVPHGYFDVRADIIITEKGAVTVSEK